MSKFAVGPPFKASWQSLRRTLHRSPYDIRGSAHSVAPDLSTMLTVRSMGFCSGALSYNTIIVDWGCCLVSGVEGNGHCTTDFIRVNARPFVKQIRNSLVTAQGDHIFAHHS